MDNALWINNILEIVEAFSSAEYQDRVWIKGEKLYCSSFVEADCGFFDDNIADQLIDVEWRKIGLTLKQRDKLASFRDALKKLNKSTPESPSDMEIVGHPEWPNIRRLAREALEEFLPPKGSYKERYVGEWWKEPPKLYRA